MIDFNVREYLRPVLPTGRYTMKIEKADLKTTKDGNSKMLSLMLKVVSDFRKNSVMFSNYNIYNSNPTATEMARVSFAQLCSVTGLEDIKNISELEGKIFDAQVSEGSYKGKAQNNIESHEEAKGDYERVSNDELNSLSQLNDSLPF